jgi:cytoskeletal protein CcmA (bactofilin family)
MIMKCQTLAFALLSIIMLPALADSCSVKGVKSGDKYFGKTDCMQATLSSLEVYGNLTVEKTAVNHTAKINGTVTGNTFTVNGNLFINGTTTVNSLLVAGTTRIDGKAVLSSSHLKETTVYGKLDATNSTFENTTVNGNATIQDSTFNGDLNLSTDLSVLNGTRVHNVLILKSKTSNPQILCLTKASYVSGNIIFNAGNGEIYTTGSSKIDGKVSGAKVIEGTCPNQSEMTIQG